MTGDQLKALPPGTCLEYTGTTGNLLYGEHVRLIGPIAEAAARFAVQDASGDVYAVHPGNLDRLPEQKYPNGKPFHCMCDCCYP